MTDNPKTTLKLTAPQRAFLTELAKAPKGAWHKYLPALKLVELGLATQSEGRWDTPKFSITEAGRLALQ